MALVFNVFLHVNIIDLPPEPFHIRVPVFLEVIPPFGCPIFTRCGGRGVKSIAYPLKEVMRSEIDNFQYLRL